MKQSLKPPQSHFPQVKMMNHHQLYRFPAQGPKCNFVSAQDRDRSKGWTLGLERKPGQSKKLCWSWVTIPCLGSTTYSKFSPIEGYPTFTKDLVALECLEVKVETSSKTETGISLVFQGHPTSKSVS